MDSLLFFDFYGIKPNLFIKKQESMKTFIGSILSLFTVVILVIIFIFILLCFTNDTGLIVLYEKSTKGTDHLNINLSKSIFFYSLIGKNGEKIDPRILKIYPYLAISTSNETKYELLKEQSCDINKLIEADSEYNNLIKFDISSYDCINYNNDKDIILENKINPISNSYINLFIAKCQNNTNDNLNNCASDKEINEFLENNSIYVSLFLESVEINHHNYSYPLTKKYYQNTMSISKDFILSYSFYWRKVEYYTKCTFILFRNLFKKSNAVLDTTIKEKNIYSRNTSFYIDKTIGIIQMFLAIDYIDVYTRKYYTLLVSLTLFIAVFIVVTKLCWVLNYIFTKSILYYTIFEPFISKSTSAFYESFESHINIRNHLINFNSPNPFGTKLQLNQKRIEIPVLQLNNNKCNSVNKSFYNNSSLAPMKSFETQKIDRIKKLLNDIHNNRINHKIQLIDNYLFFFAKIFKIKDKKQKFLRKLEKMLQDELSIDYLFFEFKKLQLTSFKDMNNNVELEKKTLIPTKSTKGHSSHTSSLCLK
jgi:hypothetical protein